MKFITLFKGRLGGDKDEKKDKSGSDTTSVDEEK